MTHQEEQDGFTIVELLVTLFVAAAFIATGYQLYYVITRDGSGARNQALASNLAYDYIRRYSTSASKPCLETTATPSPPSPSEIPNPEISVEVTCPYGANTQTSKIAVTVKYGTSSPKQEVTNALYVTP